MEVMLPVLTIAAISSSLVRGLIMSLFTLSSTARKGLKGMNYIIETARISVDDRIASLAASDMGDREDLLHELLTIVQSRGAELDFGFEDVKNEAFAALYVTATITLPSHSYR